MRCVMLMIPRGCQAATPGTAPDAAVFSELQKGGAGTRAP